MNPFSEQYKTFSNLDLLGVLEHQADYQPEAVGAAKTEIEQRKLSDQERAALKNQLEIERRKKEKKKEKRVVVQQKVKTLGATAFDVLNPIQTSTPTAKRLILLITLVFGFITLFTWYNQFELVSMLFSGNTGGWDWFLVEYFLPLILLPFATLLFWLHKKNGWILMAGYLTYSAIGTFGLILMTWNMEPSGSTAFGTILPQTSPSTQILATLFFGGILWVLTKKEIREQYHIGRQTMIATIGTITILKTLLMAPFLLT